MKRPNGYSRSQIALHWVVFFLIALQFLLHEPIAEAWGQIVEGRTPDFDPVVAAHVFGGIVILVLALWRIVLRRTHGAPQPPETEPALLRRAAHVGHMALYGLMILMPLSGAVAWFGGLEAAGEAHEAMKPLMLGLIAIHVLATLWHQFWLRDNLLERMKRPSR